MTALLCDIACYASQVLTCEAWSCTKRCTITQLNDFFSFLDYCCSLFKFVLLALTFFVCLFRKNLCVCVPCKIAQLGAQLDFVKNSLQNNNINLKSIILSKVKLTILMKYKIKCAKR